MANVGYVANSVVSTESVNMIDALEKYGHTVTTSTQAAFGSGTFSAQDVIVVAFADRDDSAFIADLDTHMDTHGVPLLVLRASDGSPPNGLNSGTIGRNASDDPDTVASALGIIALERRSTAAARPDPIVPRTEAETNLATEGLLIGHWAGDAIMISEGGGDSWTEIPERTDPFDSTVQEVTSNAAGTRLLNDSNGFTSCVVALSGASKVGTRTGQTFATRVAWFGVGGDDLVGRDAAAIIEGLIIWLQDNAAANDFPTTGSNGVVLAHIDLSFLTTYQSGLIAWTQVTPASTSVLVEVSDDNGATFSTQTNGAAIPVLSASEVLANKTLLIRVTLASTVVGSTPTFASMIVTLRGEEPPIQDLNTAGAKLGVIAPDAELLGGQVVWVTGKNKGTSMEIRQWTSGTRTIRLFLNMELDIVAGDVFDIRPGCQKRAIEDCKDRYANVVNFRGEPYVPGTDQITKIPDAQ